MVELIVLVVCSCSFFLVYHVYLPVPHWTVCPGVD